MLSRFRIVTVSMERLQIGKAPIEVIPINMVDLDAVLMLEEQPTVATAPALLFQQLSQSEANARVSSLSRAPVHPVAIIGTPVALDLDMPDNGHIAVVQEAYGLWVCGGGSKGQTRA
jgi:hypothetical protein